MSHNIVLLGNTPTCVQCGKTSSFGEVCAPNARSEKEKLALERLALERLALEKSKQQNTLIMFFCGCGCFLVACFLFQSLLGKGIDWADRTSEKLIAAVENTATEIEKASHVLSGSLGGGMLATVGKESLVGSVVRRLWSFFQQLMHREHAESHPSSLTHFVCMDVILSLEQTVPATATNSSF